MILAVWTPWFWTISGWGVVLLSSAIAIWAVAGESSQRRPRCPRCWYDMTGCGKNADLSLICPECGRVAKNERTLRSSRRRRWKLAAFALLIALIGVQLAEQPRRAAEGWTRLIPTTMLVLLAPRGKDAQQPRLGSGWRSEIVQAASKREMLMWQLVVFESRTLPVSDDEVLAMFPERVTWLADQEPVIRLRAPESAYSDRWTRLFWAQSLGNRDVSGEIPVEKTRAFDRPKRIELRLPKRPLGRHIEHFEVELRTSEGSVIRRWRAEFPCRVVASLDDVVPAADSPELREKIIDALTVTAAATPSGETEYTLRVTKPVPRLGDSFVIRSRATLGDTDVGAGILKPGRFRLPRGAAEEQVMLELWSDQPTTAIDWNATAYWSGRITVPLSTLRIERR